MHTTRAPFARFGLVLCGALLAGVGCASQDQPSLEAAKAVKVLRHADPRTLYVHGGVSLSVWVPAGERDHAREYALDALKTEALREYPSTTLLFDVRLTAGADANSFVASGVAGRSRGD